MDFKKLLNTVPMFGSILIVDLIDLIESTFSYKFSTQQLNLDVLGFSLIEFQFCSMIGCFLYYNNNLSFTKWESLTKISFRSIPIGYLNQIEHFLI